MRSPIGIAPSVAPIVISALVFAGSAQVAATAVLGLWPRPRVVTAAVRALP